jgi:hypothetical protein
VGFADLGERGFLVMVEVGDLVVGVLDIRG